MILSLRRKITKMHLMTYAGVMFLLVFFIVVISIDKSEDIEFSTESGFYERSFYLGMSSANGSKIYYTLDSTEPDETSLIYSQPILISDNSMEENVYSMIKDVTIEYRQEAIENPDKWVYRGYSLPDKVDKCTVVTAVAIDKNGNRSDLKRAVYWIGYNEKTSFDHVGVISIVSDPYNLFSDENGIFVTGDTFKRNLIDGKMDLSADFYWYPANYRNRGREWEAPCYIEFWDNERNLVLCGEYGIRIQGGASRALAIKGINIYSSEGKYGGVYLQNRFLDMKQNLIA